VPLALTAPISGRDLSRWLVWGAWCADGASPPPGGGPPRALPLPCGGGPAAPPGSPREARGCPWAAFPVRLGSAGPGGSRGRVVLMSGCRAAGRTVASSSRWSRTACMRRRRASAGIVPVQSSGFEVEVREDTGEQVTGPLAMQIFVDPAGAVCQSAACASDGPAAGQGDGRGQPPARSWPIASTTIRCRRPSSRPWSKASPPTS
jgi:hypothetical protein